MEADSKYPDVGFDSASRASWVALCDNLTVDAVLDWEYSVEDVWSHHGRRVDRFEGFARLFLAHAFRVEGEGPTPQTDWFLARIEEDHLTWPHPSTDPKVSVDAAALALGLWVSKRHSWDRLSETTRAALILWFVDCATRVSDSKNNWRAFSHVLASFVVSVDGSKGKMRELAGSSASYLEQLYAGDGWYTDGTPRTFDYYNSFAFHFYVPLVAWLEGNERVLATSRERLDLFTPQLRCLIGADGAPVYFGRSLTYRWAVATPFAVAALVSAERIQPAECRAVAGEMVEYFLSRSSVDDRGVVRRGWLAAERDLAPGYSGPWASYWLAKVFVCLLLPEHHPFWSLPGELAGGSPTPKRLRVPNFLVSPDAGGAVSIANHGSYDRTATDYRGERDAPLYSRLAYSTVTSPAVSGAVWDSSFTLVHRGNAYTRDQVMSPRGGDDWAGSSWPLVHPRILALMRHLGRIPGAARVLPSVRRALARLAPKVRVLTIMHASALVHVAAVPASFCRAEVSLGGWAVGIGDDRTQGEIQAVAAQEGSVRGENWASHLAPLLGLEHGPTVASDSMGAFESNRWMPTLRSIRGSSRRRFAAIASLCVSGNPYDLAMPHVVETAEGLDIQWADGARHLVDTRLRRVTNLANVRAGGIEQNGN